MNVFFTRKFDKFLKHENLASHDLEEVTRDILEGRAIPLGAKLFKIRMRAPGRGKSGGFRAIFFFKVGEHIIYLVIFAKNERENITGNELRALKLYAKELDRLTNREIIALVENGSLIRLLFQEERGAI